MIVNYLKTRFSIVQFFLLAVVLSIMVFEKEDLGVNWLAGILFLFISLFVFRLLDDAGSVYYDREHHPERRYLDTAYYSRVLKLIGIVIFYYMIYLAFCPNRVLGMVSALIVLSICLYVLFSKNYVVLPIISLLKYPVLLGCLSLYSVEKTSLSVLLASFFVMASYDSLETVDEGSSNLWKSLFLFFICGILSFQPWENVFNWSYVLLIIFLLPFFKHVPNLRLVPILYYPIIVFTLKHL